MHVVRGSLTDVDRDRAISREMADLVERTGRPAIRAWTPPRQVAFGRRDAAADGCDRPADPLGDAGDLAVALQ